MAFWWNPPDAFGDILLKVIHATPIGVGVPFLQALPAPPVTGTLLLIVLVTQATITPFDFPPALVAYLLYHLLLVGIWS